MRVLAAAFVLLSVSALTGCPKAPEAAGEQAQTEAEQPIPETPPQRPAVEVRHDPAADEALAQAERESANLPVDQAVDVYLQVAKTYPQTSASEEALFRAGTLYIQLGDYQKARQALDQLLYENPLFEKADQARLQLGQAELQTGDYRDAYQTLSGLLDKVPPEQQPQVLDAAIQAAVGAGQTGAALQLAINAAASAQTPQARQAAVDRVADLVDSHASFLDVAKQAQQTATDNPAWPVLNFKLARIYYHLRDWEQLTETLQRLLQTAPQNPYAPEAQQMLARINRRSNVYPKVVGVLLPMSGRYQPFGEAVMRGVRLALEGSDLQLVVKDTQGDVTTSADAVEQLTFDSGAIAAIGPLLTDTARRAAVVSEELELPLVTMTRSEEITAIGPHIFRNMLTNSAQAQAVAEWATKTMGFKSFATLYPDIPYGTELANDFWDAVLQNGGQLVGAESYQNDQTTFSPEVKRLVGRYYLDDRPEFSDPYKEIEKSNLSPFKKHRAEEKLKDSIESKVDFDAIFIPDDWRRVGLIAPALAVEDIITNACDPQDLERIEKTTGKKSLKTVALIGSNQWSSPKGPDGVPQLITRGGKFVNCALYVDGFYADSERPATRRFVRAFHDAYKDQGDPGLLEAIGFDTARMLRLVIDRDHPATREQLRDALSRLRNFEGATGRTSFNDQREAVKPLFFLRIHNGQIEEINPSIRLTGS